MDQLYGFSPKYRVHWWLLPCFVKATEDTTPDRKFVIFDGPVDAIWIENMNTVLDDKKAVLFSGEMIAMSMKWAWFWNWGSWCGLSCTVSGWVVYMEPLSLGLTPLFESWYAALPEVVTPASRHKLSSVHNICIARDTVGSAILLSLCDCKQQHCSEFMSHLTTFLHHLRFRMVMILFHRNELTSRII